MVILSLISLSLVTRKQYSSLLLRYCLEKEDSRDYVLCDVIGQTGTDHQWKRECFRVVGDNERPLLLQSLWKPKEGFSRRFEIQRRSSVEEQSLKNRDTITAGELQSLIFTVPRKSEADFNLSF